VAGLTVAAGHTGRSEKLDGGVGSNPTPPPVTKWLESTLVNKSWHAKNKLLRNYPLEKKVKWHTLHQKNCGCRPIPKSVTEELKKRKPQDS
jgi:hypothetical protein